MLGRDWSTTLLACLALLVSLAVWPGDDPFERPKLICTALGLVVAALGITREEWAEARRSPLLMPLAAILTSFGLSMAANGATRRALMGSEAVADGLFAFAIGAALILVLQAVKGRPGLSDSVLAAWLVGTSVAAGYAVAQRLGLDPVPWGVREAGNLDALAYRPFGTLGNPSFLAMTLAMVLPIGVWFGGRRPILCGIAVALGGLALALTMSRAGILAGGCGLVGSAILLRDSGARRFAILGAFALALGCVAGGWNAPTSVGVRFARLGEGSTPVRRELFRAGAWAVARRPLTGWGPANATEALVRAEGVALTPAQRLNPSFHDALLDAAGERGALGLFGLLWFATSAAGLVAEMSDRDVRIAFGLSLLAYAGTSLVGFATVGPWLSLCVLLGAAPGALADSSPRSTKQHQRHRIQGIRYRSL